MKKRGYVHKPTTEQIRQHMALAVREKLLWLENAARFTDKLLKGKTRKIWEAFRSGEI